MCSFQSLLEEGFQIYVYPLSVLEFWRNFQFVKMLIYILMYLKLPGVSRPRKFGWSGRFWSLFSCPGCLPAAGQSTLLHRTTETAQRDAYTQRHRDVGWLAIGGGAYTLTIDIRVRKPNSWTYNFIEVSGHKLESSQTWGFCMGFLNLR